MGYSKIKYIAFIVLLLLIACPKKSGDKFDPIEQERKEALRDLMDQEEEFFDELPESDNEESDDEESDDE